MVIGYELYLDGFDLTPYGTPHGYSVAYQIKNGGQGGLMLDGSERIDELAVFPVVTFPCMPLTESQLMELMNIVMEEPIHELEYHDPAQGWRTLRVRRQVSKPTYRGIGANGEKYWVGVVLTLNGIEA